MKKILFVVDYFLSEYNSVRDILSAIIKSEELSDYEFVFAKSDGNAYYPLDIEKTDYTHYTSNRTYFKWLFSKDYTFIKKISIFFNKIRYGIAYLMKDKKLLEKKYLEKIIKIENPHLVYFFVYCPLTHHIDVCMKHGVETIVMLYDTYIGRPEIDIQVVYQTEKQIMNNTKAYFVPYHCKNEYLSYYDESSFICYKLPLFVEKEIVLDTYRSKKILYDFSYFGQLQTFRNPNEVHSIFKQLNITLNIFTSPIYNDDGTFVYHPTITEEDLFYSIVCSKFLVILDNNAPYEHYLPSKAILYASFTKPIIVFGKNNHSALLDFLQDYPYLYYHNLESPIDGFVEFLNKPHIDFFDEKVYQKYIDYLPKNALKVVTDLINSVSDINKSNKHTI